MHPRKTPQSLRGQRCVSCHGTGGLRAAKLVLGWEWKKNHVPGAVSDPKNLAVLCRLCEEAYRMHLGQIPRTGDLEAVFQLRQDPLMTLVRRRADLLETLGEDNLFGSFGKVVDQKDYQAGLEREASKERRKLS